MYLAGTLRDLSSKFGMVKGNPGCHTTISKETETYPTMARLLSSWAEGFSEEYFGSVLSFTSIEIRKTQDARFCPMKGRVGTVMVMDVDDIPNTRFYIKDTSNESPIRVHTTANGPTLLRAGIDEYMPAAYNKEYTVVIFYIAEGYQSCPRSTWNLLMRLGYARSRFSGACFQGLNSFDVNRFNTGRMQLYMDSERDAKSVISDEDSEYPEYGRCEKFFTV